MEFFKGRRFRVQDARDLSSDLDVRGKLLPHPKCGEVGLAVAGLDGYVVLLRFADGTHDHFEPRYLVEVTP